MTSSINTTLSHGQYKDNADSDCRKTVQFFLSQLVCLGCVWSVLDIFSNHFHSLHLLLITVNKLWTTGHPE